MLKINKKILLYITYASILLFILFKFNSFILLIDTFFNLINPLIYGFIIAFILNIIIKKLEKFSKNRKLNIILSILIIFILFVITILLLIPQMINSINLLKDNIPGILDNIKNKISFINKIDFKEIVKFIKNNYNGILLSNNHYIKNIIYFFINLFLGFIISIIMLNNKEKYIYRIKIFLKNKLSKNKYNKIINILNISNNKFQIYIKGQFIISLSYFILTYIFMLILKIPYSLSISILIFTLSLIPVLGLFIAYILGVLLLSVISIKKMIIFIIMSFIIKQIIDYFIRVKVFNKSLDIPNTLLILSTIYFSLNFGIIGAILSIPITSILYNLYKE